MKPGSPAWSERPGRPWVGREAESELIAELLHALDEDREGAVVEVAGEPGVGKSRFLLELRLRAAGRGHLVLSGKAAEFETELPFGVFADAMDDWLEGLATERLQALAGPAAVHLTPVLPAFERVAPHRSPELQQERYRTYRAVRNLLSAMATDAPVVLAVDDVQWADPASIELLSHLIVHPPGGAVLVALGLRPAQEPAQLKTALAAAARERDVRRLLLRPLDPPAARQLLGPGHPDEAFERLYRESGGNPFFLLQLARSPEMPAPAPATSGRTRVPEPVRAALATELSSLPAGPLLLLQGAAVTGDPFDLGLAAKAADIDEADVPDVVDELLRYELVHHTAVPGELGFRHPIVRAAVYELTTGGWRTGAHRRLAAVLGLRGATSSAQAPHIERSAAEGDSTAISTLVCAGDADARRAPALAARWYAAALRLLPEGPRTVGQRVDLMIALATALGGDGQLEASRRVLSELLDRLPPDHPAWVSVVAYCAGVEHLLGRHRAAEARLRRARGVLNDPASVEAVRLMVELAAGAGYENRHEEMLELAQEALDGATLLAERSLAVAAAGQVALARYFLGLPADEAMDRAATAADALEDEELAGRLDIGLWVGWTEAVLERHDQAIAHCQRVIDVSRATGQGAVLLVTMTAQAWSLIRFGRLAEAEELLAGAIEAGYLAPNLFLSVAVGLSSVVATYQGRYDAALRSGEESVRLARSADPGLIPGMSGLYNALPLIEMGRPQRAREILLVMSGGGPALQTSRSGYAAACEVLTRAELARRNVDAAEEWARRAEVVAGGGELAAELACARRATATVALAREEPARAAEIALDAATRAEGAGAVIEAERCRIVAARALAQAGDDERAVAELQRAVEGLGRVGARGYRAEAEKELRRLRRRLRGDPAGAPTAHARRAASREGVALLTRSERAVVALVADGLTNPEVAHRLYLSPHTVKRHLANAMGKLHVRSRRELRALSREPGEQTG